MFHGQFVNLKIPVSGIGGPAGGKQNGCIPVYVPFKNTSSAISGTTSFTWDFGDGVTEQFDTSNVGDSVMHTYLTSVCGIQVSLRAENECGSSVSTWSAVNAYTKDNVSVSPAMTRLCYPDTTVTFTANVNFNCYIGTRKYFWDFGDGTNTGWITLAEPLKLIISPGPDFIQLPLRIQISAVHHHRQLQKLIFTGEAMQALVIRPEISVAGHLHLHLPIIRPVTVIHISGHLETVALQSLPALFILILTPAYLQSG